MKKKYKVIYADPPWRYKVWSGDKGGRTAESYYPTMTPEDLKGLSIDKIADNNSVLFLWTTFPCLPIALEIIKSWGFNYKTVGFVWIKKNKIKDSLFWGMGYYTRANSEVCLIATRGKSLERKNKGIHQIIESKIEKHSQKPDEVRKRIVELFGDIPRIELFARKKVKGWDSWGNEIKCDIKINEKET